MPDRGMPEGGTHGPGEKHPALSRKTIGLRVKLFLPFLGIPLAALALVGSLSWWLSGRVVEQGFDRMLGDKLELAVEVITQLGREHLLRAKRLGEEPRALAELPGQELEMVAVKEPGRPLQVIARGTSPAELAALKAQLDSLVELPDGRRPRFTLVHAAENFFAVATAPLARAQGFLIVGKRLTSDLLTRFSSLAGAEMGLFAGWQRAAISSFTVDLSHCQNCHDAAWRVERISEKFHPARSFKGRRYFTTSLADGFRYAFMPLELEGRRVAMVVIRHPLELLTAARRQALALLSGGGGLLLLLSLGAWWVVSGRITRPLAQLRSWMDSASQGGPVLKPHIATHDEVQRLAESMSATLAGLRESRDRLDTANSELRQIVASQSSALSSTEERLRTFLALADAPEKVPDPHEIGGHLLLHLYHLYRCAGVHMVVVDPTEAERIHCLTLTVQGAVERSRFDPTRDSVLLSAAKRSRAPFRLDPSLAPQGVRGSGLVIPIALRGQTLGALALGERQEGKNYSEQDVETLATLVHQGVMALDHALLYAHSQEAYLQTTFVLVKTIEEKDPYLRGHSDRVSRMAVGTAAMELGLGDGALKSLGLLARFHDVGKICIDSSILLKRGRLTPAEFEAVKRHVEIGEAIVGQITSFRDQAHVIGQHHERYDGKGYLKQIGGEEISLGARIIAVSDTFDAMTSARPYRPPFPKSEAVEEIKRGAGSHFDPRVVRAFCDLLARPGGLRHIPLSASPESAPMGGWA